MYSAFGRDLLSRRVRFILFPRRHHTLNRLQGREDAEGEQSRPDDHTGEYGPLAVRRGAGSILGQATLELMGIYPIVVVRGVGAVNLESWFEVTTTRGKTGMGV